MPTATCDLIMHPILDERIKNDFRFLYAPIIYVQFNMEIEYRCMRNFNRNQNKHAKNPLQL